MANSSSTNQLFYIYVPPNANEIAVLLRDNSDVVQIPNSTSVTKIHPGVWHHIVWVDTNGTTTLYIDGVADGHSFNYTPSTYTFNLCSIGCINRSGGSLNYMNGNEAQVAVFNVALTRSQVLSLYNRKTIPAGAVGYWPLNELRGSTAYDRTGNGNNGTIANCSWSNSIPTQFKMQRARINRSLVV